MVQASWYECYGCDSCTAEWAKKMPEEAPGSGKFELWVDTTSQCPAGLSFGETIGMVFLINHGPDSLHLSPQTDGIPMIREAKDASGEWRPIEYWSAAWCGESYGALGLEPDDFLGYQVPAEGGNFKTQLRVRARVQPGSEILVSNTYTDWIFPNQFDLEWHEKATTRKERKAYRKEHGVRQGKVSYTSSMPANADYLEE